MCDLDTENDIDEFVRSGGELNRRQFGKMSAVASFVAALPSVVNAAEVTESEETISTCLLYTSPSPRDLSTSRMPSSA